MKRILFFFLIIIVSTIGTNAQRKLTERQKRTLEAKEAGGEKLEQYKAELLAELTGKDEEVYHEVAQTFYELGMEKTMDSIWTLVKKRFPKGQYVRNLAIQSIYDEKDPVEKEKKYQAWLKRYSPKRLGEDIVYDYGRVDVGAAYAEQGNVDKALEYANAIQHKGWRGEGYSLIASYLNKSGYPEQAAMLYQMAWKNAEQLKEANDKGNMGIAMMGYPSYLAAYADVCYRLGRQDEALAAMEKLPFKRRNFMYANLLTEANRPLEAFVFLWEQVRNGNFDANVLEELKALYVKLNGSEQGLEFYLEEWRRANEEKMKQEIAKSMISQPAPDFTLTDVEGKEVKLSDLRGKVVVLDFWATWCGPCKRSFPAMQKAVEKFQDDSQVEFLFIHTWEKEENATETAVKFLKDNGYTFRLLMDLKDPQTKANPVVKSYNVSGIPAKFVIDPQGNIRFKVTGASGSDEKIVSELTLMIEMARQADLPK